MAARIRWGRALLVVSLLAFGLIPVVVNADIAAAHEAGACATENGLATKLAEQATYIEHNTTTKAGTPVDDVYHFVSGVTADGRVIPVHMGGPHGFETAYSPTWMDYIYYADMAVLHWTSPPPCSGPDDYAFAATVQCGHADFSTTHCYFDAWVGLQVGGGEVFPAPWGYSHRKNASPRQSCYAEGGRHEVADSSAWVRTFLYLDGSFTAPTPDHPFNARKSTSKEVWATSNTHLYNNGPCWPGFCDATTPPNNNASTAFNSCNLG